MIVGEHFSGRLSLNIEAWQEQAAQSVSANFDLRGKAEQGSLELTGPLGSLAASAQWNPQNVTVSTHQGTRQYADLEQMTRAVFGQTLPVAALFDWLHAQPWAGAPAATLEAPAQGFQQLGWQIDLSRYGVGILMAQRAAQPKLELRIKLDQQQNASP